MENQNIMKLPVLALKGITIFPDILMHFDVNKEASLKALEAAMEEQQEVFLVAKKEDQTESSSIEDTLYTYGTITKVKQIIKLPQNIVRVLAIGKQRGSLEEITEEEPYLQANVIVPEETAENTTEFEADALKSTAYDLIDLFYKLNPKFSKDTIQKLKSIDDLGQLADGIGFHLIYSLENKQKLLSMTNGIERLKLSITILHAEVEIEKIKKEIQVKVKQNIDKNQKDYYLKEQIKVIQDELGDSYSSNEEMEEYKKKAKEINCSEEVKTKIEKEIRRLEKTPPSSSESSVIRNYIEWLIDMPWDDKTKESKDLKHAEKILNEDHYGLTQVKERILEHLAVRSLSSRTDSPILCLVGPPGTGKTSIAKSIGRAIERKYVRISLGGVRDESEIRGHRRTYVGAMPGRVISALRSVQSSNPLILLDEIDKMSHDFRGDPSSALLEVLDGEQNYQFRDHYLEVPFDLSDVLFIATANSIKNIPKPLHDRLEIIEVHSYTENEKVHIASKFLLPKQKEKHGLDSISVQIHEEVILQIIQEYTKEAGVRNLERKIRDICRKVAKRVLSEDIKGVRITSNNLHKYLGTPRYQYDQIEQEAKVGIARGLAWTEFGGDTLSIEVNLMEGNGKLELTGRLGDVMKESAKAAISYIRSSEIQLVDEKFYQKKDIHIHVPEGAVPKDGPSAGITMATALISALTKKPVNPEVAMTGEITIRGRVLAIGGLKEKLLAAKRAGIKKVLVPKANEKDIHDLQEEILKGLEVIYVSEMEQVLKEALLYAKV